MTSQACATAQTILLKNRCSARSKSTPRNNSSAKQKKQVMDPLAYQTFENSPLPPKLRPTTHARVSEGIHSFGQEFLGFPPEEGVSSFSELAAPEAADAQSTPAAGGSPPHFELRPKIPGVGMRMTVLRLGNGEVGRERRRGGVVERLSTFTLVEHRCSFAKCFLSGCRS